MQRYNDRDCFLWVMTICMFGCVAGGAALAYAMVTGHLLTVFNPSSTAPNVTNTNTSQSTSKLSLEQLQSIFQALKNTTSSPENATNNSVSIHSADMIVKLTIFCALAAAVLYINRKEIASSLEKYFTGLQRCWHESVRRDPSGATKLPVEYGVI